MPSLYSEAAISAPGRGEPSHSAKYSVHNGESHRTFAHPPGGNQRRKVVASMYAVNAR